MFGKLLSALLVTGLMAASQAVAQAPVAFAGPVQASRTDLETDIQRLERAVTAESRSEEAARQRLQIAAIHTRLTEGDFRAGDRIAIAVQSQQYERVDSASAGASLEQQLSDTFTVASQKEVRLPVIGAISLHGVLRSELEAYLTQEIGRVIREPVLRASPLIRVSVQGAVSNPGYYTLPADGLLSDALMVAGGPTATAKIKKLRIERDGKPLWQGEELQRAVAGGRTILEMGLRAGDQFIVPEARGGTEGLLRTIATVLSIPIAIYTLSR